MKNYQNYLVLGVDKKIRNRKNEIKPTLTWTIRLGFS